MRLGCWEAQKLIGKRPKVKGKGTKVKGKKIEDGEHAKKAILFFS
jgi:hypothetical protein